MPFSRHFPQTLAVGVISVLLLSACGPREQAAGPAPGPVEVGVVTLVAQDVPLTVSLPGRTNAYRRAEVRPQVGGVIKTRLFEEGTEITSGAQLYQIDDASYQAAYRMADAELARTRANLTAVGARETRLKELLKTRAVSQQDYDDVHANLGQAQASVKAAEASLESARVNLAYTRVLAPIDGVIGKSSVTEGALVTAGQSQVLAILQQLDPIYVDISQSADEILRLRRQIMSGSVSGTDSAPVRLLFDDGSTYEHEGQLQFSEMDVNASTGTVMLRALFPNPDRLLLPGMFVRTELQEGVRGGAVLVSQRGVSRDRSGGATALVVNAEGLAELRTLRIARALGDQWLVEEGLAPGDQVIVEGLQRVRPGAPVKAVPAQIAQQSTGE